MQVIGCQAWPLPGNYNGMGLHKNRSATRGYKTPDTAGWTAPGAAQLGEAVPPYKQLRQVSVTEALIAARSVAEYTSVTGSVRLVYLSGHGDLPPGSRGAELSSAIMATAAVLATWGTLPVAELATVLFYCDCYALLEKGSPLTDLQYLATHAGVAAKGHDKVLRELVGLGRVRADAETVTSLSPLPVAFEFEPILGEVKELWDAGRLQLRQNSAWQLARSAAEGGKGAEMELRLGMQQFAAADPWLADDLTAEEAAVVAENQQSPTTVWD